MSEIEDILDEFDFQRVQDTMKALGWKYHDTVDTYPSIGELRKMARRMLTYVYNADPCPEYLSGSGGFEAVRHMYIGDDKKYLALKFVVTEWNNYD